MHDHDMTEPRGPGLVSLASVAGALTCVALVASWLALRSDDPGITSATKVGNLAGTIIYPAAISGTTNDWAPTGLSTATTIVEAISGDTTLTSLTGGVDGRRLDLCNSGSFNLTLAHDTGGTAANRFYLADAQNWILNASAMSCASFVYDGTASRWRMLAKTDGSFPLVLIPDGVVNVGTAAAPNGSVTINGSGNNLAVFGQLSAPRYELNRADTSLASPSAVGTGEVLNGLVFNGYNGSSYVRAASITATSAEAFTGSANGTKINLNATATGATSETTNVVVIGPGNRMSVGTGAAATNNNQFQVGPAAGTFHTFFGGHIITRGTSVSFSSCGTGPACNSAANCSDTAGTFTVGTTTTTCTISFLVSYGGADDATCVLQRIGSTVAPVYTVSATQIVATTIVASAKYHYICIGH